MDVTATLDREVIIERAEAVRFWLLGFTLSNRATGAIQRELGAIIADDPGANRNGQRPLAGLTVADFVAELHSLNGGAIGRVKSVGDAVLRELRAAIPADIKLAPVTPEPKTPPPAVSVPQAMIAPAAPEAPPAPKRRGRPKGSTRAARLAAEAPQRAPAAAPPGAAEPKRRPGRPPRAKAPAPNLLALRTPAAGSNPGAASPLRAAPPPVATPAPTVAAPPVSEADPALHQLVGLWPSLHPHARRAILLYTSTLLAETSHEGT